MVSACLLGRNCKYNGGNNYSEKTVEFVKDKEVIEVCPEVLAGLGIPRIPIEIVDGVLRDRDGNEKDTVLRAAIAQILEQIEGEKIQCAVRARISSARPSGICAPPVCPRKWASPRSRSRS